MGIIRFLLLSWAANAIVLAVVAGVLQGVTVSSFGRKRRSGREV